MLDKKRKEELKKKLKDAAYTRKLNNQYEFLKKWDSGEINGVKAIEGIELEGKVFRIESDLINANENPTLPKK